VAKAVKKHGLGNFAFIILEFCDPIINIKNNEYLLKLETYYLQKFKPSYNILKISGSSLGYKHSEETKERMKVNYSKERKDLIGSLNRGKTLPEEVREK
jgi:group I intron endonuclease